MTETETERDAQQQANNRTWKKTDKSKKERKQQIVAEGKERSEWR